MIVRAATGNDVPALTALYNDLGVATTASYDLCPVTVDQRLAWLDDHMANNWPVLVADDDGQVAGFAAYGAFREKPGYRFTVEHSVYVDQQYQGCGVGRALMTALIDVAKAQHIHTIVGLVDATNADSIAFHQRLGFFAAGTLPHVGHKFGRWLDVTFLVLTLPEEGQTDECKPAF